ncbi:MAG: glycosyltransferase family 2 protein [Gammaproteobacteria bacterium]|nr:glycosyltransferase family 2 protein [Gammaproteobacteria bacterium]
MNDKNGIVISIIIPTLNEAENIKAALDHIYQSENCQNIEVIISDGGSVDLTVDIAARYQCRIIRGNSGRAQQMNRAARQAKGDLLLFLHADTRLPHDWFNAVGRVDRWGFFPLKLSGGHWLLRIIEGAVTLRSRLTRLAGGDQALFFKHSYFEFIGGFSNIPLMEDIAICKEARRTAKPHIPPHAVITSSRRWESKGIVRTVLLMWLLRLAYFAGFSPESLHRLYYPQQR